MHANSTTEHGRPASVAPTRSQQAWGALAFEALPIPVFVVDELGQVEGVNGCGERVFGCPRSAMLGTELSSAFAPEDRFLWGELLALAFSRKEAGLQTREVVAISSEGKRFPVEISMRPFAAEQKTMIVVSVRDLSESRRLQEQHLAAAQSAHEARERLEAMLEFAPAFILAVSAEGKIDFINRTLPQYSKKDTIGTSWLQYFLPAQHASMETLLKRVYENGSTELYEVTTPGPDGGPLYFESHVAPVRVGGQVVSAVLVSQDVTERKRAQAELLSGRQMALLGTLAAGVAHEINTPIQFVGDSIEFLRDTARDLLDLLDKLQSLRRAALEGLPMQEVALSAAAAEEAADLSYVRENMPKAFDRCIDGLKQVSTIVHSLKEFAHPTDTEMAPTDINRAVQSSLTIATNEYKYVAHLEVDLGEIPFVTCHGNEIGQAVLNIVINAAHAIGDVVKDTDRKGLIVVRTRREGDAALITITDSGGGIPAEVAPRVFDPFFTTKEVGRGTGQGLAIAWSTIKERHGGDLTFETRLGEGTTFTIRLPIQGKRTKA